jgi:hypothetical protein
MFSTDRINEDNQNHRFGKCRLFFEKPHHAQSLQFPRPTAIEQERASPGVQTERPNRFSSSP